MRFLCQRLTSNFQPLSRTISLGKTYSQRTAAASSSNDQDFIPGEPDAPKIITQTIPGPKSKALMSDINKLQSMNSISMFMNYDDSLGNYLMDADGNLFLDMFTQIASIPIGYNHQDLLKLLSDPAVVKSVVNRPAIGSFPSVEWPSRLKNSLMTVAPKGLNNIVTMACGSCSNENAFKVVFFRYRNKQRGGIDVDFSREELDSCMINESPGSPKLSILSFNGSFHGRTFASLSATHSKPVHKIDVPALDWPMATFPSYKYPLEENVRENTAEDDACIVEVEERIEQWSKKGVPVAGIIVEPIQCEGGDNHGSPEFFQKLQNLTKKHDVCLIIDEVQTGCGPTGKFWCHEHFGFQHPVDVVTFSKKMLTGGFYTTDEFRAKQGFRIFNTWMGDPSKVILLQEVLNVIRRDNLLNNAKVVGDILYKGLQDLGTRYPGEVLNLRGKDRGTMIAFDSSSGNKRDAVLGKLKQQGIFCGGCGDTAVRLRPTLVFTSRHASIFFDKLEKVFQSM